MNLTKLVEITRKVVSDKRMLVVIIAYHSERVCKGDIVRNQRGTNKEKRCESFTYKYLKICSIITSSYATPFSLWLAKSSQMFGNPDDVLVTVNLKYELVSKSCTA